MKKLFGTFIGLASVAIALSACNDESKSGEQAAPKPAAAPAAEVETPKIDYKSLTDARDGKVYKYVKIDKLDWLAENLNFAMDNSKCPEEKAENCEKYGRLYLWDDAMKACPEGWRLPTEKEFDALLAYAVSVVGKKKDALALKAKTGWLEDEGKNGNGIDALGFAAMPAGYYMTPSIMSTDSFGKVVRYWSSTERDGKVAEIFFIGRDEDSSGGLIDKEGLQSVRCVK